MERVRENLRPVLLDLARHDRDGFFDQRLDVRLLLAQHIDGAAGVKSPDDHIDAGSAEPPSQVEGPWKLVGLDSNQSHDKLGRKAPAPADNLSYREFFRSLIEGDDLYFKIAERSAVFHRFGQTVQHV